MNYFDNDLVPMRDFKDNFRNNQDAIRRLLVDSSVMERHPIILWV